MKKLHRFFVSADLSPAHVIVSDADIVHQAFRVLRLAPGEDIVLLDGKGAEALCHITALDKKHIACDVVSREKHDREPLRHVTLYLALIKRDAFEWAVQKAVEAGVSRIVPVSSHRTVKSQLKPERLQAIMREAAEQCGRVIVPSLGEITDLAKALAFASANASLAAFFDTGDEEFQAMTMPAADVAIFIGPEGGWDGEERSLAEKHELRIASLGKAILRAETAATIAVFLAAHT